MNYLPSKKIINIIVVLLALTAVFFLFKYKDKFTKTSDIKDIFSNQALKEALEKDTDGDGLNDWEESLWKTDINKTDTDGDGTSDGDEVKAGRNPAKAGPDDKVEKVTPLMVNEPVGENWTKTDVYSRDFMYKLLSLQQSGNLNDKTKEQLTNDFISGIDQEKLTNSYQISDLKVINDNSEVKVKKYGNELGVVMKKDSSIYAPGSELAIFKTAVEKNNEADLQKLSGNIDSYNNMIKDCLNLEVPSDLANLHLNLINSLSQLREITTYLKNFTQDPVGAMIGLRKYEEVQSNMVKAFIEIKDYFTKNKIIFNSNEPVQYILQQLK